MRHTIQFIHVESISEVMHRVRFKRPDGFSFTAGQFINIFINDGMLRSYSIASHPDNEFIDLIIRFPDGSRARKFLEGLLEGDDVQMMGPFGRYVYCDSEREKVHIVTGAGIGPNFSMLFEAEKRDELNKHYMLFGVQRENNLPYQEQFDTWQEKGLNYYACLSKEDGDNQKTFSGRVLAVLESQLLAQNEKFLENKEFYICGQPQMVVDVVKFLLQHGVAKEKINHEAFNASK